MEKHKQGPYFNTTNLEGEDLRDAKQKATNQNDLVIELFREKQDPMTPSEVWKILIGRNSIKSVTPLTSIRRSITSLTTAGLLELTTNQKTGMFGRPEGIWKLSESQAGKFTSQERDEMERDFFND